LPHVFDLFVQERQDPRRPQGGLGLGLAIVRTLVEAHGGSVMAESAGKGAGATFTVRLHAVAAARSAPATVRIAAPTANGHRVLLVDDNQNAAELLADSLRTLGHTVDLAFDGPAALAKASACVPDVALLDLGLPVMDGLELAERLRTDCGLERVPLIAVTGYAQEVDRERTAGRGFHAHLVKPIDVHALDEMIRALPFARA
jgi:CheY-like chemotaxis protein